VRGLLNRAASAVRNMQAPKRRKVEVDFLSALQVLVTWLQEHSNYTTSHLMCVCRALQGDPEVRKVRTIRTDVRLNNLEYFESLGASRHELWRAAAMNGDLHFLNNVIKTKVITTKTKLEAYYIAAVKDSVELTLWAMSKTAQIPDARIIDLAYSHSALKILDVLGPPENVSFPYTLKLFLWLQEKWPAKFDTLPRAVPAYPNIEITLWDHLHKTGWGIPYENMWYEMCDWERARWLLMRWPDDIEYPFQFKRWMKLPKDWDFEWICDNQGVDFNLYRKVQTSELTWWIEKTVSTLPLRPYLKLASSVSLAELEKFRPESGTLRYVDNLTPLDNFWSLKQVQFFCDQAAFCPEELQHFWSLAIRQADVEICEYLLERHKGVLEVSWPDGVLWLWADSQLDKLNWLNSLLPKSPAAIFALAKQCFTEYIPNRCIKWVLERVDDRYIPHLARELNTRLRERYHFEARRLFNYAILLYPRSKQWPFPFILKSGVTTHSNLISSEKHIGFIVKWRIPIPHCTYIQWPDNFEVFERYISYFGVTPGLDEDFQKRWSEKNYQKYLLWKARV
jgi:hypothetical protein